MTTPYRLLPVRPGELKIGDAVFFGERREADPDRKDIGFGTVKNVLANGADAGVNLPQKLRPEFVMWVRWRPTLRRWSVRNHNPLGDENLFLVEDATKCRVCNEAWAVTDACGPCGVALERELAGQRGCGDVYQMTGALPGDDTGD